MSSPLQKKARYQKEETGSKATTTNSETIVATINENSETITNTPFTIDNIE